MKKLVFLMALVVIMLAGCGTYEENPQTGQTEYHGVYSDDPSADAAFETSVDMMMMSAALN